MSEFELAQGWTVFVDTVPDGIRMRGVSVRGHGEFDYTVPSKYGYDGAKVVAFIRNATKLHFVTPELVSWCENHYG